MIGTTLHEGHGAGALLVLHEAVSLWGGTDVATGRIVDEHHPQRGALTAGRVVAMPGVRGSSSSATVLAEQLRRGVGPAAILLRELDAILVLGAIVAYELYARQMPIVVLRAVDYDALPGTGTAVVSASPGHGRVVITPSPTGERATS